MQNKKISTIWRFAMAGTLTASLGLAGCSVVRTTPGDNMAGHANNLNQAVPDVAAPQSEAMMVALGQLGVSYRYGGASRKQGFDCSGLIQFAYARAGIELPRTAREQFQVTERLERKELRPGDLVFFRIKGRAIDHVGMYIGGGRFIHAPRPGKDVEEAELHNAYWSRRYAGAGRVPLVDKFGSTHLITVSE